MTTAIVEPAGPRAAKTSRRVDASVDEIIHRARSAPAPARGALAVSLGTALLMWAAFTPLDWGPLGWVCLVPLLLLVRPQRRTRWMYGMTFLGGWVFSLAALQWMRLGDVWMYPAWIGMALYMALYFPAFLAITRVAVHRYRVPLLLAAPVAWVGLEFIRAHFLSGFAWYFLGHTQHAWTALIQISDLVGVYGVSFLLVLGNAVVAGLIGDEWLGRLKLLPAEGERNPVSARNRVSVATLLVLLAVTLIYGAVRRGQAEFTAGPRVALIQGNFPSSLKHDPTVWQEMYRTHEALTGIAVREQPELIIWPETMFTWPLLELQSGLDAESFSAQHPEIAGLIDVDAQARATLTDLAEKSGASLVIGLEAIAAAPDDLRRYNSAAHVDPLTGLAGRYDKLHRVPFGEFIPLADSLPWLRRLFSYSQGMGIAAGEQVHVFNVDGYRLVPNICFEDTVPHLNREMIAAAQANGRPVDCFVNLTNDGWFTGSSEQEQHLITASFRCIENRTAMVRAVNTGISGIIDGDGLLREPEVFIDFDARLTPGREPRTSLRDPETGALHKELNCVQVGYVPLDNRGSLYTRWGDWFAGVCALACLTLMTLAVTPHRLRIRSAT